MSSHQHKNLSAFLKNRQINDLLKHANKLKVADTLLQRYLPVPLAGHVHVGNIKDNTLILLTDSAALSTRLQFITTEVLDYMRNTGGLAMLDRIKVRTKFTPSKKILQKRSANRLSEANAELLNSVAMNIGDERLEAALMQIAKNRKPAEE